MQDMEKYDVAVIGGGAAGLMAAIAAAQNQKSVVIIERNEKLGKKILATGNGRCNLTNKKTSPEHYHSSGNVDFVKNILNQFDQFATIKFFENLGLVLKEEARGRVFPRNDQAQSVVDTLVHEIESLNIEIKLNSLVRKISKNENWDIVLESGDIIQAEKIIITTGGRTAPQFGTTGDAYFWLEKLGHTIIKPNIALVPLETIENWPQEISGLRVNGVIKVLENNNIVFEKEGDILFTHFGLSGPAAMSAARAIAPLLTNSVASITIDLYPESDAKSLDEILNNIFAKSGAKLIKNTLSGIIATNLTPIILKLAKVNQEKKAAEISKIERGNIVQIIKNLPLSVKSLRPAKEAQVTAGGISTAEVNDKTMESKIISELYLAGEVLDVDGDSGGFNLQWAWSSGHVAGSKI